MQQCPDDELQQALSAMQSEPADALNALDGLLARYPSDARLSFMRGSVLAGQGRPIEAHAALKHAVELAPDFAIARFQLGLFELTSGEADAALSTWGPLDRLPGDHYLRSFVEGLRALIRDEFAPAIEMLRIGIERNQENLPLNRDMQLLIDNILPLTQSASGAVSETSFILGQFSRQKLN